MYSAARTCARPPQTGASHGTCQRRDTHDERAEWQVSKQAEDGHRPDAGHAAQQLFPLPPTGLSRKRCVSSLSRSRSSSSKAARLRSDDGQGALAVLQFGRPHLDDLPAASDQGFQFTGGSRDQRLSYDTAHLTEVGDHSGVERSVFASLPCERANSRTWRGLTTATAGGGERGGQGHLIAPGGFHDDTLRLQGLELDNQSVYPFLNPRRAHRDIHPAFDTSPYEHRSISTGSPWARPCRYGLGGPGNCSGSMMGEADHANPRSRINPG